jgi:hypothetical protein
MTPATLAFDLNCWSIRLKMRGPLLTTSSAPLGFGIDAPFARNAAGDHYLAGSLVKGRIKEAWQELADSEAGGSWDWARWMGKEPPQTGAEDWDSERGLLQFTDFTLQRDVSASLDEDLITYRIARDRQTHSVRSGQNLMIQSPFAAGGEYWFEGRVWAIVSPAEALLLDRGLHQGLCFTPALGAETSVGFGVIADVEVARETQWTNGNGWGAADAAHWGVAFAPEGPLCLAGRRIAENIFESEPDIAGSVIKGALAALLLRLHGAAGTDVSTIPGLAPQSLYKDLCREFSKLRVLHAKPVLKGGRRRPQALPLSAIKVGDDHLKDAALTAALRPVDGYAPAFQFDWKREDRKKPDWETANKELALTPPAHELRVRTQIETDKRRARDQALFAYRMLAARALDSEGGVDEYEWLTEFGFGSMEPQTQALVKAQLAALLGSYGLPGVGKLKTRCQASRVAVESPADAIKREAVFIVTLQTPALLCDVEQIGDGLSDASQVYADYWKEASQDSFELDRERFYASQDLAGGGYLWRRFSPQRIYRPYVLTRAGSTFVLKATGRGSAEERLALWRRSGLPLARTVCDRFGLRGDAADWQRCPYVPENGFGEIAVDPAWQWEHTL